jgi:hypothetical protein
MGRHAFISSVMDSILFNATYPYIACVSAVLEVARPLNSYATTEEMSYLGKFRRGLWATLQRSQYLDCMALDVG